MSSQRLLLLSPTFHGYARSIASAAERSGYAVTTHLYDHHPSLLAKIAVKTGEALERVGRPRRDLVTSAATAAAIAALHRVDPDVVLVVKGDLFDLDFWQALDAHRARPALWLYDELRRTALTDQALRLAGPIASYSPADVATLRSQGHRVEHVPLAHDPHLAVSPRRSDEVVFVGARYPRREELLTQLAQSGVPIRAYGRDWSAHPFDRLRTWRLAGPQVAHGRDLERGQAYGVMAGALATLNIHGDQDGFTMRTFEACGVGALQLIDRTDVGVHYEPGTEILTFESAQEAAALIERARSDAPWSQGIRGAGRRRTLAEHTFDHRFAALEQLWA